MALVSNSYACFSCYKSFRKALTEVFEQNPLTTMKSFCAVLLIAICLISMSNGAKYSSDCLLPRVQGICKAYQPRFAFNSRVGRCEPFIYGGCGGNKNRFDSLRSCNKACAPQPEIKKTKLKIRSG